VVEVPIVIPAPNTREKSFSSNVDVLENKIIPTRICIPTTIETVKDSNVATPASNINEFRYNIAQAVK
jgi:hypothetical protein